MNRIVRLSLLFGVAVLAVVSASSILAIMRSDAALGRDDPAAALRARPYNPEALMQLAGERLTAGDMSQVEALAKRLLASSPADGRGYRLLAQVSESRGQQARAAFQQGDVHVAIGVEPAQAVARVHGAGLALVARHRRRPRNRTWHLAGLRRTRPDVV